MLERQVHHSLKFSQFVEFPLMCFKHIHPFPNYSKIHILLHYHQTFYPPYYCQFIAPEFWHVWCSIGAWST